MLPARGCAGGSATTRAEGGPLKDRSSWNGWGAARGSAAPSPLPGGPAGEEGSALRRALALLRRRALLFGAVAGAGVLAAAAATLVQPPAYRAEATIEVRPERPRVAAESSDSSYLGSLQVWENYFRTQEILLRSPGLLEAVLRELPAEAARPYASAPDPAGALARALEVETVPSTFLLNVALVHPSAEHAARIVNAVASRFLEEADRRLRDVKSGELEALDRETLPAIRRRVEEAERALRAFQDETGFADFEEQYASLVESRRKLAARLADLRLRRAALAAEEEAWDRAGTAVPPAALARERALEGLRARRTDLDAEIAREETVLKDRHPRLETLRRERSLLETRIREASRGALEALRNEARAARFEEISLLAEQERVETRMSDARLRLDEFRRLEAERAAARQLYDAYLRKHGEIHATSGAGLASVRVVDFARPPAQPHRQPRVLLTLGALLGLLLGAAAVTLAEQMNDRLSGPAEAEALLGRPVLAVVPRRPDRPPEGTPLVPEDDPATAPLEAFRALRAGVRARLEEAGGVRRLAIVSAGFGEGRSTVAVNLARVLALEGRRVLLFDAELRRPRLKAFLANPRGPGLEEFLRGERSLAEAVQPSRLPGVDVFGAEQELEGPAEVAGSPRFGKALHEAGERYPWVVIDTGPVLPLSEPAWVARRAEAALLVVEEGRTRRSEARAALRRLEDLGVNVLGLVVNKGRSPQAAPPMEEAFAPGADVRAPARDEEGVAWA